MVLTDIFHSGFELETEQSILIFDYCLDPSGVMDGVLRSEKLIGGRQEWLYPWWPSVHRTVQSRAVRPYALHYRLRNLLAHEGIY